MMNIWVIIILIFVLLVIIIKIATRNNGGNGPQGHRSILQKLGDCCIRRI